MIVNIRGTNGAGKSTIPMQMMELDPDFEVIKLGIGKNGKPCNPAITVFHKLGWVALGTYFNKTGGLDLYSGNAAVKMALDYVIEHYPEYDILMEGFIVSGIQSTYGEIFHALEDAGHQVLIIAFVPPFEVCLERVYKRNGNKPIKEKNVLSKYRSVLSGINYFRNEGFTVLKIDNSKCPRERMLKNFMRTVEKHRR